MLQRRWDTYRCSIIESRVIDAVHEVDKGISNKTLAENIREKLCCTSYEATEVLYREICQTINEQSNYSLTAGSPVRAATFGSYAVAVMALFVSIPSDERNIVLAACVVLVAILAIAMIAIPYFTLKRYNDSLKSGDLDRLTRARDALAMWLMENSLQD